MTKMSRCKHGLHQSSMY